MTQDGWLAGTGAMTQDGWQQPPPQQTNPYGAPPQQTNPYGAPPPGTYGGGPMPMKPPTNGKAIAALVLGILGCCGLSILAGIPALILGILANKDIKASGGAQGGGGMAIAGIVLGSLSLVGGLIFFVLLFASDGFQACLEDEDSLKCKEFKGEDESPATAPSPPAAPALAAMPLFALAGRPRSRSMG